MFWINIKCQIHMQGIIIYRKQRQMLRHKNNITTEINMKEKNEDSKINLNRIPKHSIPIQIFSLFGI